MKSIFLFSILVLIVQIHSIAQQDSINIKLDDIDPGGHQLEQKAKMKRGNFSESDMLNRELPYPEPAKIKKHSIDEEIYWGAGMGALIGFGITELIIYSRNRHSLINVNYTRQEALTALLGTLAGAGLGVLIAYNF